MNLSDLPGLGKPLASGLFAGITTRPDGTHHAVVLTPDAPAERMTWQDAMAWAASVGAELPTRPVSALLFSNLRSQFERSWYWNSESHEDDGSSAWSQHFLDGYQLN